MNSLRFGLPQQYRDKNISICVDEDRSLGTPNGDGPLITDLTQAIIVVEFGSTFYRDVLLAVRIQDLIERVCSTCADVSVPWAEWRKGTVIVEGLPSGCGSWIYVHGTHLVVLTMPNRDGWWSYHHIRTFDFGRHGCGVLPLWDEEGGGVARKASFFDGRELELRMTRGVHLEGCGAMGSLGNGIFFQVGHLSYSVATAL